MTYPNTHVVVSAFTEEQVMRLASLTSNQLRYWDKVGFFKPQFVGDSGRTPYARIYSFQDVVGLRTIALLKGRYGVSTQELRRVAGELSRYSAAPWADITLYVWNRKVQFDEPETGKTRGVVDGQYVLLPLKSVMDDVERDAAAMRQRNEDQFGKVENHRHIAGNSPVIAGTRIAVSTVLRFLEDGYAPADILKEYPTLTLKDIEAAKAIGVGLAA